MLTPTISKGTLAPKRYLSRDFGTDAASTGAHHMTYLTLRNQLPEIKRLYFQRQYKLCAARCIEMLHKVSADIDPAHAAYLNFYAALSYDVLARGMHQSSSSRLPTLQLAEQYYTAAISKLQDARLTAADQQSRTSDKPGPSEGDEIDSDPAFEYSPPDSGYSTAPSRPTTARTTSSSHERSEANVIDDDPFVSHKPSPLRVYKAPPHPTPESLRFSNRLEERDLSAELAALLTSPIQRRDSFSDPLSSPSNDDDDTFVVSTSRHIRRYETHLTGFLSMLQAHLDSVRALIAGAQSLQVPAQGSRPASRASSFNSGAGGSPRKTSFNALRKERRRDMSDEEKAERIKRGREVRWARERFCAEKYETLCRRALAELR